MSMSGPGFWQAGMDTLLGPSVVQLGHLPWRATVLLVLAFALALLLRHRAAALRHRVWAATLIGLVLLPLPALLPLLTGLGPLPAVRLAVLPAAPPEPPPPPPPAPRTRARGFGFLLPEDAGRSIYHLTWSWRPPAPANESLRNHGLLPPGGVPAAPIAAARPTSAVAIALLAVWLVGAAVLLGRTLRARRRLRQLLRVCEPVTPGLWPGSSGVRALETDAIDLPITVGVLHPAILLPRAGLQWPLPWRRAAVAHEVAHLKQRDPLLQAIAELATALYWFHPLAWLAARQLRIERELAADDRVLLEGSRSSDYAQLLVTLACAPDVPPVAGAVLPLLTPSGLKARLLGILDPRRARFSRRAWTVLLALAGAVAMVPLAAALPVRVDRSSTLRADGTPMSVDGFEVGRVLDERGRPLAGAEVDFLLAHRVLRAVTGPDGVMRIPLALPDRKPPQDVFTLYARKGRLAARKNVMAVPFGTPLPMDLTLAPGRTLRGSVTSSAGKPVAGARLHIVDWQSYAVGPGGGPLAETAADGTFTIPGLLYGEYTVLAVARGGVGVADRLHIADGNPDELHLRLPDTDQLSGWLRDEQGKPLAGVRVERVHRGHMYPRGRTGERHVDWDVSGPDGGFRMLPLGDSLFASARDGKGELIEAIFSDGGVAQRLLGREVIRPRGKGQPPGFVPLQRPARLSVKVQGPDGQPVPSARIHVSPTISAPLWTLWGGRPVGLDGQLPEMALPPGSVRIDVRTELNGRTVAGQRVSLAPGERKVVTIVLGS
jgi:beta-lactamase regulating signal transducer with metallopeptidase domain